MMISCSIYAKGIIAAGNEEKMSKIKHTTVKYSLTLQWKMGEESAHIFNGVKQTQRCFRIKFGKEHLNSEVKLHVLNFVHKLLLPEALC